MIFQDVEGGFKLVFGHGILFGSGSAVLREEARPLMADIAKFIRVSGYQAFVEGHTDNLPIRTELYPSNEALSLARAFSIVEYLKNQEGLSPKGLAIMGYGAGRPVGANSTAEGRTRNRRVEIIFKNQRYF
jgi:chemotaxis protein MotB